MADAEIASLRAELVKVRAARKQARTMSQIELDQMRMTHRYFKGQLTKKILNDRAVPLHEYATEFQDQDSVPASVVRLQAQLCRACVHLWVMQKQVLSIHQRHNVERKKENDTMVFLREETGKVQMQLMNEMFAMDAMKNSVKGAYEKVIIRQNQLLEMLVTIIEGDDAISDITGLASLEGEDYSAGMNSSEVDMRAGFSHLDGSMMPNVVTKTFVAVA
mmetsp:Transcript_383/g.547  ORF Transcript_383/g.547 Transcript_383/m.547 type:complete len:219 (-) Transcript_383:1178-1834(-)